MRRRTFKTITVLAWTVYGIGALELAAQSDPYAVPNRGIVPWGTYSLDKIETVNVTNGNIALRIPLASLPAGRAGSRWAVDLFYNSTIWNLYYDPNNIPQSYLLPVSTVDPLDSGGWHYSFDYTFVVDWYSDPPYLTDFYRFRIILPDGSSHILCRQDGCPIGDGYYAYQWFNPGYPTGILNFYSADSTFLRATWNASTGAYTLYLPDGGRVQGYAGSPYASGSTDIYDRNNNHIQVQRIAPGSGSPQIILTDDIGRQVTITRNTNEDVIVQSGYGGQPLTWHVYWSQVLPPSGSCPAWIACPATLAVTSITLPNSLSYNFQYANAWVQMSRITLPSGASADYTYPADLAGDPSQFGVTGKVLNWYDENSAANRTEQTTYIFNAILGQSEITKPDGSHVTNRFSPIDPYVPTGGLVYKTENQPAGETVEQVWRQNIPYGYNSQSYNIPGNPFVQMELRTRDGLTAPTYFTLDRNGNKRIVQEYDWIPSSSITRDGNGRATGFTGGTILRTTSDFVVTAPNFAYTDTSGASVNDSAGYWNLYSQSPLALVSRSYATGSGPGSLTEFTYDSHGNVLQQRQWDSTKGSQTTPLTSANAIITTNTYDSYGNLLTTQNPRGYITQYTYGTVCTYGPGAVTGLYPTQIVQAYGTSDARTFTFTWDCYGGVKITDRDENHNLTRTFGYDPYSRITSVQEGSVRKTGTAYNDANRTITATRDKAVVNDQLLAELTRIDTLGGVREAVDAAGNIVRSNYLVQSGTGFSFELISNPYVTQSESTMGWTRTKRDTLGRVVEVAKFSGAALPDPWGSNSSLTGAATNSYSANCTTATDEGGVSRTSCVDGLGRLTSVTENGISSTTTYGYDALDNLTSVTQPGGSARTFTYSSLKRLISAANPESGTTNYTYDNNGNLATRTDARGVVTTMAYNALDQVISKTYSDGTPGVTYTYSAGWLVNVSSGASAYNYTRDPLGRVTGGTQTTDSVNYPFLASLYPFQGIKEITYPNSNRKYTTGYDAGGRAITVSGQIGANPATNYVTATSYAPHGGIASQTLGNGLTETRSYNSRLQPTGIQVGGLLAISNRYDPNPSADWNCAGSATVAIPGNNGNVLAQSVNGVVRNYSYDGVNRLCRSAQGSTWAESYSFDTRGNIGVSRTGALPAMTAEVVGSPAGYGTNNRVTGWAYDTAGNITGIPAAGGSTVRASCASGVMPGTAMLRTACYDAENRMVSETDANGATAAYVYDGDGRRVSKTVNGVTTVLVYDPFGQLAQEYGGPAIPASESGTRYITADHLGSTRLVTKPDGTIAQTYDYLPFGQEFTPSTDTNRFRFTGKERDAETGLDFFEARYLSSAQGRFSSPDPLTGTALHIINPQRWNMYAYALNNPLAYTDPDGRDAIAVNFQKEVPLGGHEGIISVHANGTAEYARFGPVGGNKPFGTGQVDVYELKPVQFGPGGLPTDAAYKALAEQVAGFEHQDPSTVRMNYFKTSEAETQALDAWIKRIKDASDRGEAPQYDVTRQNCATFCIVGLIQAGAIENKRISLVPNKLFELLTGRAADNYPAPRKKTPAEQPKKSHSGCLIDRETGECVK
jgi:RHS repeat-associated protein